MPLLAPLLLTLPAPAPQFCVIEGVIPRDELDEVRESVIEGRKLLAAERAAASERRQGPQTQADRSALQIAPDGQPDAVRPPMPPPELNEIACNEVFAEHLAEPRVVATAKAMLDSHLRIAQTEVNKSRAPDATPEQAQSRGWHSDWPHDLTAYHASSQEPWRHCGAVAQPCAPSILHPLLP